MKKRMTALCLCLLLLAGCAVPKTPDAAESAEGGSEMTFDAGNAYESGNAQTNNIKNSSESESPETASDETETLFVSMPASFLFCSGAGGWSTALMLEDDGSFSGLFRDSDMGDTGADYPNGTCCVCEFTGCFTQPRQMDDGVWSMGIAELVLTRPADGTAWVEDGVRYIAVGPYGLENAEELLVYLPETPAEGLNEWVIRAAMGPYDWQATDEGTLGLYEIYNVNEEVGFVEYPRA